LSTIEFLRLFHPISDEDFALLTEHLRPRAFKKGEVLIAPGQVQRELYFVKSGVQMSYFDTGEKSHVIAFTYAPNLCAIPESFSLQRPSPYWLTCLSDTEVECLSFDELQRIFDRSQAIERLFRKMTEAILAGMINRHIELHSLTIEERFRVFCQRSPHLLQLVPHKYIASYLGIDPTNFSKLFNSVRI
jgi:CRP-like cAMP-binding protein